MNKKLPLISLFIMSIISIFYWTLISNEELYEAQWNAPDTTLAITINGEVSTSFPTSANYSGDVVCSSGTGDIAWDGSKWILNSTGIIKGNTKCNITFVSFSYPDGWNEASSNSLLGKIRDNNTYSTPLTIPGRNVNGHVLTGAFDDYGTSYYFRGAVKNNYVKFANKCWRILRVTGNGAIKLGLHNDNSSNVSSPCSSSYNSDTAAFANYSGTTQTSTFNASYNDNAYVGFMYGVAGASNYSKAHANSNKSVILTNLETWYINNLASYDSRIADVIWCNDKSTFATFYDGSSMGEGLGYGTNQTTYTAYNRINGGSSSVYANPSLKCPKDNNGGNLSKFTVSDTTNGNGALTYKIGLITADEAAFAGFKTSVYNRSNYLAENVGENYYWTMSPGYFDGSTGTFGEFIQVL